MNKKIFIFLLLIFLIINIFINKIEYFGPITQINTIDLKLPKGRWLEKCRLVCWNPPILTATCQDDHNKYINSSINVDTCYTKEIHADDGHLDCH